MFAQAWMVYNMKAIVTSITIMWLNLYGYWQLGLTSC